MLLNIHRKTPVLEYLFNKVAGLQVYNFINPLHATYLFLYPLKTSENL